MWVLWLPSLFLLKKAPKQYAVGFPRQRPGPPPRPLPCGLIRVPKATPVILLLLSILWLPAPPALPTSQPPSSLLQLLAFRAHLPPPGKTPNTSHLVTLLLRSFQSLATKTRRKSKLLVVAQPRTRPQPHSYLMQCPLLGTRLPVPAHASIHSFYHAFFPSVSGSAISKGPFEAARLERALPVLSITDVCGHGDCPSVCPPQTEPSCLAHHSLPTTEPRVSGCSYSLLNEYNRRLLSTLSSPKGEARSFFLSFLLGLHLRHMEVPRLGVKPELQLLAYTTATAMRDPSRSCDLHHSHSNAGSLTH